MTSERPHNKEGYYEDEFVFKAATTTAWMRPRKPPRRASALTKAYTR